jgi:hypothetical protein
VLEVVLATVVEPVNTISLRPSTVLIVALLKYTLAVILEEAVLLPIVVVWVALLVKVAHCNVAPVSC